MVPFSNAKVGIAARNKKQLWSITNKLPVHYLSLTMWIFAPSTIYCAQNCFALLTSDKFKEFETRRQMCGPMECCAQLIVDDGMIISSENYFVKKKTKMIILCIIIYFWSKQSETNVVTIRKHKHKSKTKPNTS